MPATNPIVIETGQALDTISPAPGEASLGRLRGGPEILLDWLETQLGLAGSGLPFTDRVTQYAALLDDHEGGVYHESFQADRWATAADLLQRRDELRMAGWDGADAPDLPELVHDLAAIESTGDVPPGVPDRLEVILAALNRGQTLPDHSCRLEDTPAAWPPLWRQVLDKLQVEEAPDLDPAAPEATCLGRVQAHLLGEGSRPVDEGDGTFQALQAVSEHETCQAIAAMLAAQEEELAKTVIYTPDDSVANLLDGALRRLGLPTMGARRDQAAQPALQVLPLVVEMLWEPVDPHVVLDFLSLPVGPIPSHVAGELAEALSEQPGLGSAEWEKAWAECTTDEADPDGRIEERLDAWFDHEREPVGEPIPAARVRERCSLVARWAHGYAQHLADEDDPTSEPLEEALRTASTQAATLGELAQAQGGALSKPQLVRMLEDVRDAGARSEVHAPQAAGPILVDSLADIPDTCERLVWIGTGLDEEPTSRWTARERDALLETGVEVDDGTRELRAIRAGQRRGITQISEAILIVRLPADANRRPHPLWIQSSELLPHLDREELPTLQEAVTEALDLDLWTLESETVSIEPPQPQRPLWEIPAELIEEPSYTSAGEMRDRLGCPLRWVFDRVADIDASDEATLPSSFRLKGLFCHDILERVFEEGGEPPAVDEAVEAVGRCFDERLELDAAPLARPAKLAERKQLRNELQRATRVFVEALHAGDYRVVEMEHSLRAEIEDRRLFGRIDSILESDEGEAVIDFKYGGITKYRELLDEGRAIQLAVYAAGRAEETQADEMPEVGYLILSSARLYTPEGSPLQGVPADRQIDEAPGINTGWQRFQTALERSRGWLEGDTPVPARPLKDEEEWPAGTELVVDADGDGKSREPCKYCDYDVLCGLRRCE